MKSILTVLFACCALSGVSGQLASDLFTGQGRMRNSVVYLFDGKEPEPTVVRVKDVFTDYESKGFFRIGVLPIGAFEGVTFELGARATVTNSLIKMHEWLSKDMRKRIELRHVRFLAAASPNEYLEAERARLAVDGEWKLLGGVKYVAGANEWRAASATLQLTGEHAGRVILETSPALTNNLFAVLLTNALLKRTIR